MFYPLPLAMMRVVKEETAVVGAEPPVDFRHSADRVDRLDMRAVLEGWAHSQERANPPFSVRKLSILMHGSEKALVLKEKFMKEASPLPPHLLIIITRRTNRLESG